MTSLYGPIVESEDVRAAVEATIAAWLDAYVAEVERQKGITLPPVRHYDVASPQTPDQMPAVVIVAPGIAGEPARRGDGTYDVPWAVGVGIVVAAETRAESSRMCSAYTAALRALLLQQASLGGFAEDVAWLDEGVTEIAWTTDRSIHGGSIQLAVTVRAVVNAAGGPVAVPTPSPTAPLSMVAVSSTHITSNRSVP